MPPLANININDQPVRSGKAKGLYAVAKASADMEFAHEREKLTSHGLPMGSAGSGQAGFANPLQNAHKFGLREGMKVADLGSGAGHYVFAMANIVGGSGRVYAVDVQKDVLATLKNEADRKGFENVEIVWGDIERLGGTKIADELLDMVLISNTLFQVGDKNMLIAEAGRILKHGGTLVIIDWKESFGGIGPIANAVVTKEAAESFALAQGFDLTSEFEAGEHHYGIVFKKSSV